MNAIEISNLCKSFHGLYAVDHLNMIVPEGSIYGFIGENGSGKSTTEKLICGLLVPTKGKIKLYGKSYKNSQTRARMGVLIENPGCFPGSSIYQNLYMQALNLGILHPESEVDRVLELVKLSHAREKKFKKCSLGMKQRLGVAQALLGHPRLLILDEPINGLDADGVRIVREVLQYVNKEEGVTILISSHILGELSKIATHYGILREGKLIQELTAEELKSRSNDHILVNTVNNMQAYSLLRKHFRDVQPEDEGIRIYGDNNPTRIAEILLKNDISVTELEKKSIGLEEYYVDVMKGVSRNE